jgi:hypothetical protein
MINRSNPTLDENHFAIEFSSAAGDPFLLTIPTVVIRDYLPILEKQLTSPPASSSTTSFFRVTTTWSTALPAQNPFVVVKFDRDEPLGFSADDARCLARDLLDKADRLTSRSKP